MKQRTFSVTIRQTVDATTPEHAAREVAWKLIRWDVEKYGPLWLRVEDDEGCVYDLSTDDYAPVFVWDEEGGGIS